MTPNGLLNAISMQNRAECFAGAVDMASGDRSRLAQQQG